MLSLAFTLEARAHTFVVPDDFPTINAALEEFARLDLYADTVLVRGGTDAEHVVMRIPGHVYVIGIGDAHGNRPKIASVEVTDDRHGGSSRPQLENLHVLGNASMSYYDLTWPAHFVNCTIDSSVIIVSFVTPVVTLTGCTVGGDIRSWGNLTVDSCEVLGSIVVSSTDFAHVSVRRSTVHGTISSGGETSALNVVENVTSGIALGLRSSSASVLDNTIRPFDGTPAGIFVNVDQGSVVVRGNRVFDAATGIRIESFESRADVLENLVLRSVGDGIVTRQADGIVADNVVGRSGGQGIYVIESPVVDVGPVEIRRNTTFANGGAGIWLQLDEAQPALTHNIGFGNRFGLVVDASLGPVANCNDWFGNDSTDVRGIPFPPQDLAVDPRFCDLDAGDVRLMKDSPLADAAGCGRIGALPVGCASTATLVERFDVTRVAEGVRLAWILAPGATAGEVWAERAATPAGPWTLLGARHAPDAQPVEIDRATGDRTRWYRLVATEGAATLVLAGPVEASASPAGFALRAVSDGAAPSAIRVRFALPRTARVALDAFDLQGRKVASLARGVLPAGEHAIEGTLAGAAKSGIVWVCYTHPEGRETRRFARLR